MGSHEHSELIAEAFRQVQSEGPPEIGEIISSYSDPLSYRLVDIVGDVAICDLPNGTVKEFPLAEIADVNKVNDLAMAMHTKLMLEGAIHRRN